MRVSRIFIEPFAQTFRVRRRGRLVRQYFLWSAILISGGLITSGVLEMYFRYREGQEDVSLLQQEIVNGAAFKVAEFIRRISQGILATSKSHEIANRGLTPRYKFDLETLLYTVSPISELVAIDPQGAARVYISRSRSILSEEVEDFRRSEAFQIARQGKTYFGPVYFVEGSEPYMTIAVPIERYPGRIIGVLQAQVNLKYIWEVISSIKVGKSGRAYIVNRSGDLIAHPDISLVLRRQNLGRASYVRAALDSASASVAGKAVVSHNLQGRKILASYASISSLDWTVFVEQPIREAFAPLYASLARTSGLILVGLGAALFASLLIARRVVRPLEALRRGVERIGKGDLEHHLAIQTGDEIEVLADEFNKMADELKKSYRELEGKVIQRTKELSALYDVTATSARSLELEAVLQEVIKKINELFHFDATLIYLFDAQMEELKMRAAFRLDAAAHNAGSFRRGQGIIGRVAETGEAMIFENVQTDPRYRALSHSKAAKGAGFNFFAVFPIRTKEKIFGTLHCNGKLPRQLSAEEVRLITTMADQIGVTINNINLFEEVRAKTADLARSVEELRVLGEVGQAVTSTLDLQTVLTTIVSHAVRLSGADNGGAYEFDEEKQALLLRATYRLSDELIQVVQEVRISSEQTVVARAAVNREPVQVTDILDEPGYPLRDLVGRTGVRAILGVPLMRNGSVVGVLIVGRKAPGRFQRETIDLLQTFATQSVLAIQNARLFRDIEAQRQQLESANERLKELDKMKSSFVSNVSHELRTPITAIEGLAENMLDGIIGQLTDNQVYYVKGIKESTDRLGRLIEDLLDLSNIEAGRIELKPTGFPLFGLIHEVVGMLRPVALEKSLRLEIGSVDENLMAWADRDKIVQVLTNLIGNAVKFTPEQGKIGVTAKSDGNGWVQVSVADTGPGIARREKERIFDEFYQVTSQRQMSKGVGLGLAISRKLVEMHRGKMWVESDVGNGSTFFFTLPTGPFETDSRAN